MSQYSVVSGYEVDGGWVEDATAAAVIVWCRANNNGLDDNGILPLILCDLYVIR
jgi:hypothetical protein